MKKTLTQKPPTPRRDSKPKGPRLAELNAGLVQTTHLSECLAIDQALLASSVLPALGLEKETAAIVQIARDSRAAGIRRQMEAIGAALAECLEGHPKRAQVLRAMTLHRSDTVRSWAAVLVGGSQAASLAERLEAMRPFADDAHFGVREWAWMAVRPFIAADMASALEHLRTWCGAASPHLRRFAVESTRPRGVWCTHIQELKDHPERAEPLLEPLKADTSRYVQDSVANWLNDASKSQPQWVRSLCQRWERGATPETQRIISRALRTLRSQQER